MQSSTTRASREPRPRGCPSASHAPLDFRKLSCMPFFCNFSDLLTIYYRCWLQFGLRFGIVLLALGILFPHIYRFWTEYLSTFHGFLGSIITFSIGKYNSFVSSGLLQKTIKNHRFGHQFWLPSVPFCAFSHIYFGFFFCIDIWTHFWMPFHRLLLGTGSENGRAGSLFAPRALPLSARAHPKAFQHRIRDSNLAFL